MQNRMKTHGLSVEEINSFLTDSQVGRITTLNPDGYPYTVPVHFLYYDDNIYIHGLPRGQKLSNLAANPNVCFEADEMTRLLYDGVEAPCDVNTEFQSVIVLGKGTLLSDPKKKREILTLIAKKYAPHLADRAIEEKMVEGTGVIEIVPCETTGKYYR